MRCITGGGGDDDDDVSHGGLTHVPGVCPPPGQLRGLWEPHGHLSGRPQLLGQVGQEGGDRRGDGERQSESSLLCLPCVLYRAPEGCLLFR